MDADRLLDGLDPAQRRAVTTEAQPLAILAGAGSGKTCAPPRRIAHRCLRATPTPATCWRSPSRKAAAELDGRLRTFGLRDLPAAGTFHALAYAQLRTTWAAAGTTPPTLLDRKGTCSGASSATPGVWSYRPRDRDRVGQGPPGGARCVRGGRGPGRPSHARGRRAHRRLVPPLVEQDKARRGLIDFDDLARSPRAPGDRTRSLVRRRPALAVPPPVRRRVPGRQPSRSGCCAWLGDRTDLCVVGDPNQAIYS
ncbi:MAG: AAA family ATPase [Acidimicrobiales bacterium]